MNLNNLKPAEGSLKRDRRLGRGQGSIGFEGGQMPLQRRVPKHGFKNISRKEYKAVNLSVLEDLAGKKNLKKVDVETLVEAGLVSGKDLVKILGNGKLTRKLDVKAHAFSESAKNAIEALEGSIEKI
jgi:large subunit ribosomal protein L15